MPDKPLPIAEVACQPEESGKAGIPHAQDTADCQLWRSFKAGDKQALSAIYQAHFASLYNYGLKISRSEELVEDCIQDLFIELWKNRQRLGPTNAIRPYLYTCLRRKLVDALNAADRKLVAYQGQEHAAFAFEASHEANIILDQISRAQKERLAAAINALTKRQREIIFLRYYENLSFPEIATIMGLHIDSAYVLLSQATHELKRIFGPDACLSFLLPLFFV